MASGLPVVVAANGGYVEQIRPGTEGFLVRDQEEALHVLNTLAAQPALRSVIGQAARTRALEVHGPAAITRTLDNYLG